MPLGPGPGLDRLLQSGSKLRDRRPGIGHPCLEPVPQPAVANAAMISLGERPRRAPRTVEAEDRAIAIPGPRHITALRSPSALQERQQSQVVRTQILGIAERGGLSGPAGDPVGHPAPCRKSPSAGRFASTQARTFGSASDQAAVADESTVPPRGKELSFSFARRKKTNASRSSGMLRPRSAATSNGSPMSGSPFRLVNHQMARAVAASATPTARTTTPAAAGGAACAAMRSVFEDVPLTATGLSDRVGMSAATQVPAGLPVSESWVQWRLKDEPWVAMARTRLQSLSWFMKCLKEPLSRLANRQDKTRGAFLKGRSYCLHSPCLTNWENTVVLKLR